MPRKTLNKPGPKFTKSSQNLREFLGDDSESDNESFHSPETGEQTDYGLDYTSTSARRIPRANLPATSSRTQEASSQDSSETPENISPIQQRGRVRSASSNAPTSKNPSLLSSRRDRTKTLSLPRNTRTLEVSEGDSSESNEHISPIQQRGKENTAPSRASTSRTQKSSPLPRTSTNVENTPHRTSRSRVRENIPAPSTSTNQRRRPRKIKYPTRNALQEIRDLQLRTDNLIPRLNFARVVRELIMQNCRHDLRITEMALLGLQEAAEMYMTDFFEDAYLITLHRGRVTLDIKDIQLLRFLKGVNDVCNP